MWWFKSSVSIFQRLINSVGRQGMRGSSSPGRNNPCLGIRGLVSLASLSIPRCHVVYLVLVWAKSANALPPLSSLPARMSAVCLALPGNSRDHPSFLTHYSQYPTKPEQQHVTPTLRNMDESIYRIVYEYIFLSGILKVGAGDA